jgi:hypothetical protein
MFWKSCQERNSPARSSSISRFLLRFEQVWRTLEWLVLAVLLGLIARQFLDANDPLPDDTHVEVVAARALDTTIEADECSFDFEDTGELAGDLDFVRKHYIAPEAAGDTNYFIDLWEGQSLQSLVRSHGLTNNRALFVNSHGKRTEDRRFALYPHSSLGGQEGSGPYYSFADLARMMGPVAVSNVHNIILSACNAEGALDPKEIRKAFPNVTNVVHSSSGELGYQAMYFQAIVNHSSKVKPIYEWSERNERGEVEYLTAPVPAKNAKRFAPYIAELFLPGAEKPFAVQRAGRELLEPNRFQTMASAK